jgi:hypothetical protein
MKFRLSGEYGELSPVRDNLPHKGIDLAMPEGTPLRSIADGVIERVVDYGSKNLGKGVFVRNNDGTLSIYGHMSDIDVKQGAVIKAGEVLGLSGNTGNSTGPHLHYGMKDSAGDFIDPTSYAEKVAESAGGVTPLGKWALEKYNDFSDQVVGAEVKFILKPIGDAIVDGAVYICTALTDAMPEIGAAITIICGIGMMFTGNIPRWTTYCGLGLTGVILWLINA